MADIIMAPSLLPGQADPLRFRGEFAAGATTALARGTLIKYDFLTGLWGALDADEFYDGNVAILDQDIESGCAAGMYTIIIPTSNTVFQIELAAAAAIEPGDPVYYSSSSKVTTSGTFRLGKHVGLQNVPKVQEGKASLVDHGTTITSARYAYVVFDSNVSYLKSLTGLQGGNLRLITALCTAAGAEDEIVAVCPRKVRIVDAWVVARATDAANVVLKAGVIGSEAEVGASIALGGVDNTQVRFTVFDDANRDVPAGGRIIVSFSAAGSGEFYVLVEDVE